MAVFDPLDGEGVAADVPVGDCAGAAEVFLHTAGQLRGKRAVIGREEAAGLGGFPEPPGEGAPAGERPSEGGQIDEDVSHGTS